jgi:hypothetical protein
MRLRRAKRCVHIPFVCFNRRAGSLRAHLGGLAFFLLFVRHCTSIEGSGYPWRTSSSLTFSLWSPCSITSPSFPVPPVASIRFNLLVISESASLGSPSITVVGFRNFLISSRTTILLCSLSSSLTISSILSKSVLMCSVRRSGEEVATFY